ncbi:MAG: hypothetical protein IT558_01985 [Alphaproteobacteria bacterium]|nr:hypothetical protein [Alphaproteobacteria bacterium]
MKLRFGIIALFVVAALAAGFYIAWPETAAEKASPAFRAALSGFTPGTKITYKIMSPRGDNVTGSDVVTEQGKASLPVYEMTGEQAAPVTYDLSLWEKNKKDPINVALTLNPENGKGLVRGKGLDAFSAISLQDSDSARSGADWAGSFMEEGPWNFNVPDKPFRIAFFQNNIANDAESSPSIIEVFANNPALPSGGGPPQPPRGAIPGLNAYINLWCETLNTGTRVISTCQDAPMARQIRNIVENYVTALLLMSQQLTAVAMHQMTMFGALVDAKQQLEHQRLMQQLAARAHKDYHPSDMMCQFGSFIKSVPHTEEKAALNKRAMNNIMMQAYTGLEHTSTSEGYAIDIEARIRNFRRIYCDPDQNNNGLDFMCEHDQDRDLQNSTRGAAYPQGIGGTDKNRMNRDIDYTRMLDNPLTLDIDFATTQKNPRTGKVPATTLTNDETDIIALGRNMYGARALETTPWKELGLDFPKYLNARWLWATQNVAHNSFVNIVSMKSDGYTGLKDDSGNYVIEQSGWNYMKSMMRGFGISDAEIHKILGDYPSYYAQMEVLTKKMYENPDFYMNLYDKPANVQRIKVSMEAIRVMQGRDMFESALRKEMLASLLLEQEITKRAKTVNSRVATTIKDVGR